MLIGEVAQRSGVSARMLRHYDRLGLVQPTSRTGTGYREYSPADVRRLFHVESLRSLGLSLHDVGRALDDPSFAATGLVDELATRAEERIARDTELLTRLRRIGNARPEDWEDVLGVIGMLGDLDSVSAGKRQSAALASVGDRPIPAEALAEAVLREPATNVAGALRWALAQTGSDAVAALRQGLDSPDPEVRRRAVDTVVEIPHPDATEVLREALGHEDGQVRRLAALELGARGIVDAIAVLIEMVHEGTNDVDAADVLGELGYEDSTVAALMDGPREIPARLRVTQALASIPGQAAAQALRELTQDEDRSIALTATYLLDRRERAASVPSES
ncbi:MerR family transcriptional regulator [Rhodococcus fascians]|uniref:HEAT repeat domain-containing protein n=1 Tax=Rhodococcoides fascians TaxID=1828 RepID=UPI00196159E3|nr:HEAT repeat domain-containing protein [Rhodococcus fascians]MBM7246264.1 MerR family transcriptional regulator [Rhodococcus fascians]MBY3812076.1 MerR family transcriptional regulator [Rhodococcus fascians]MBY3843567.1 MerR family transcriptional regulator [Rhodococcus fascians]MBY3846143.1 MerR family transcriptional regulator [Rhodococcus fascians]MBY3853309.1 MerR family transcriptional regulator [Rhodococcus fascians]